MISESTGLFEMALSSTSAAIRSPTTQDISGRMERLR